MATETNWTNGELIEVAKRQRYIILMFLFLTLLNIFVSGTHSRIPFTDILLIIILIIQGYYIFSLAKSLKFSRAWIWLILGLFPLIGLFVLLELNSKASKILKTNVIKVGLMGAQSSDLERLKSKN